MILLENKETRVLLDAGKRFSLWRKYYGGFDQPRHFREIWFPNIVPQMGDGLYRNDLMASMGYDEVDDPYVKAVVLSHSHLDHSSWAGILHEKTTIHAGKDTFTMIRGYEHVTAPSIDTEITSYKDRRDPYPELPDSHIVIGGNSELSWGLKKNRKTKRMEEGWIVKKATDDMLAKYPERVPTHSSTIIYHKNYRHEERPFKVERNFGIDDLEIQLFPTAHSAYDAHVINVKTPDANILYTGDTRGFDGPIGYKVENWVKKVSDDKERIDALLIDCTRINESAPFTEYDVKTAMAYEMATTDDLIVVFFNYRDLARYASVHQAAIESGRDFVTFPKALLYWMPLQSDRHKEVNARGMRQILERDFGIKYRETPLHYFDKGTRFSPRYGNQSVNTYKFSQEVTEQDLRRRPDSYVLHINQTDWEVLVKLGKDINYRLIVSMSEPHDEEGEISENRLVSWCDLFEMPYKYIHTSGHLNGVDARRIIDEIDPRIVIPVHSSPENIELMKTMYPQKVKLPELYKPFNLRSNSSISSFF